MRDALTILLAAALCACSGAPPEAPVDAPLGGAQPQGGEADASNAAMREPADATSGEPSGDVPTPAPPAADAPAAAAFDGTTIPARFHGVYAAEGGCANAGDESRLVILGDTVRFHESRGPVRRAHGSGDTLQVSVELSGEGQTRTTGYRFRREDDGRRLVDAEGGMVRMRCDEKARG